MNRNVSSGVQIKVLFLELRIPPGVLKPLVIRFVMIEMARKFIYLLYLYVSQNITQTKILSSMEDSVKSKWHFPQKTCRIHTRAYDSGLTQSSM